MSIAKQNILLLYLFM